MESQKKNKTGFRPNPGLELRILSPGTSPDSAILFTPSPICRYWRCRNKSSPFLPEAVKKGVGIVKNGPDG
jgi:hypothetical protein